MENEGREHSRGEGREHSYREGGQSSYRRSNSRDRYNSRGYNGSGRRYGSYDSDRSHGLEAIIAVGIVILILFQVLVGLAGVIKEKSGLDPALYLKGDSTLLPDTLIGTKIINVQTAMLFDVPQGNAFGTLVRGTFGEVIGGPILIDDMLWWEIQYGKSTRGFVMGSAINVDADRDRITVKQNTPRGTKVRAQVYTNVQSRPIDGLTVGSVNEGVLGTIIGGPSFVVGEDQWQVAYKNDVVGWVPQNSIHIDLLENSKALIDNTPFGTAIVNIEDVVVYNVPRNGRVVGEQISLSLGTIVSGPVTVSVGRFWEVDYEIGVDGWVSEDSIERQFPLADAAKIFGATFKKISIVISIIFSIGIIILFFKLRTEISREYHLFKAVSTTPYQPRAKNEKWDRVVANIESKQPNDWRLAIMEADIMLDEMIATMMLPGDTLAERMNNIEQSDFLTIDQAWEAHRLRNKVAHEGGDYLLTEREAKRIIALYKEVFDEFHFV